MLLITDLGETSPLWAAPSLDRSGALYKTLAKMSMKVSKKAMFPYAFCFRFLP